MSIIYLLLGSAIGIILYKVLFEKKTPTVKTPDRPNITIDVSPSDSWEGSFWESQKPLAVQAKLQLTYKDSRDIISERIVEVRQFDSSGESGLIIGHCHLRDATRTFRMDRIISCTDLETGEIITSTYSYLLDRYEASPNSSKDKLRDSEYDTLRILLYVGKADGQLRAAEKVIIRDTCRKLSGDDRVSDTMIDAIFKDLEVPSLQAFKLAVGRMKSTPPEHKNIILDASRSIISTQKEVHPSEKEALDYLERSLG